MQNNKHAWQSQNAVLRIRFRNRFRKKPCPYCRSVTPFRKRGCRSRHIGVCRCRPSGLAGEFTANPSRRRSRRPGYGNGTMELGNGKLTETENVIFT